MQQVLLDKRKNVHVAPDKKKKWIHTQQKWTWVFTVTWMVAAQFWPVFGLFGFVCMFTPILLAATGWGKMSCARICPRGSFIGTFTRYVSLGLKMPVWMHSKLFRLLLFSVMIGTFIGHMAWAIPQGIAVTGEHVLYFMEAATLFAVLFGVLFKPRSWCVICPMGFTAGLIRDLRNHLRKT